MTDFVEELNKLLMQERDALRLVDAIRGKIKELKLKYGVRVFE